MDRSRPFDLFISYAQADRAWAKGFLFDALDQAGVRYCSETDFEPGAPRLSEFERAIRHSQRTLLVLSPAYLADSVNEFINLLAAHYGLETNTWPVIPLVLHPVELPTRLALLVALDATDPEEWDAVIARLCATLRRPPPPRPTTPPCPYPGMAPFGEADGERFFGRDNEAQDALNTLRLHPFLAVIGPSGCGKSSFVLAGLLPELRTSSIFGAGRWLIRIMRPGEKPLGTLAEALGGDPSDPAKAIGAALASQPTAQRLLLVVDQFEEVFSPTCADATAFQAALRDLVSVTGCFVVLTVRADFYDKLLASPLWRLIQAHRVELAPLDADGVRQAITRPAEHIGVYVEATLVERLVAETVGELGFLPFLQETLVLLWERLERRLLALHAYETLVLSRQAYSRLGGPALTGLQVAMAQRADQALHELSDEQQQIARRILLRLVQFGEGRADTRRQQPVAALGAAGEPLFDTTLQHLDQRRLLILSGEEQISAKHVDLAHEALIDGWPQLRQWVGEYKQAEIERRRLTAKADEWLRLDRRGGLLDQAELAEAEGWMASEDAADLGYDEALTQLVQDSDAAQQREQQRIATQQRERRHIQVLAGRLRWLIGALALVGIAIIGYVGYFQILRLQARGEMALIAGGRMHARNLHIPAFSIERFEVSNRQYKLCVRANACNQPQDTNAYNRDDRSDYPVVSIDALDAFTYCRWLGRRLPSEWEWEWAARGPNGRDWPWGNERPTAARLNVSDLAGSPGLQPIDSTPDGATPPPDRVFNLAGNAIEWTGSPYQTDPAHPLATWNGDLNTLPAGGLVIRGGSFVTLLREASSTFRTAAIPGQPIQRPDLGFRCAQDQP